MIALAFCLALAFLLFRRQATAPLDEESTQLPDAAGAAPAPSTIPWGDLGLAALSVAVMAYFFVFYEYVTTRFPTAHPLSLDMVVGTVLVLLVLEATRRTLGAALPVLCLAFVAYGLGGPWMRGRSATRG